MKNRMSNWEIKAWIYLVFDPFHTPVYIKNSKETVSRDRIMKNKKSNRDICAKWVKFMIFIKFFSRRFAL